MLHKKRLLSACKDFGYVYSCSCGQYHVHLKGVTIYLDERDFCRFADMLEKARSSDAFRVPKKSRLEKRQLRIVKE